MSREEYQEGLRKSAYNDQGQSMRLPIKGHILKLEVPNTFTTPPNQ